MAKQAKAPHIWKFKRGDSPSLLNSLPFPFEGEGDTGDRVDKQIQNKPSLTGDLHTKITVTQYNT